MLKIDMANAVVVVLQQEQADNPTLLPALSCGPAGDNTLSLILEEFRCQF